MPTAGGTRGPVRPLRGTWAKPRPSNPVGFYTSQFNIGNSKKACQIPQPSKSSLHISISSHSMTFRLRFRRTSTHRHPVSVCIRSGRKHILRKNSWAAEAAGPSSFPNWHPEWMSMRAPVGKETGQADDPQRVPLIRVEQRAGLQRAGGPGLPKPMGFDLPLTSPASHPIPPPPDPGKLPGRAPSIPPDRFRAAHAPE